MGRYGSAAISRFVLSAEPATGLLAATLSQLKINSGKWHLLKKHDSLKSAALRSARQNPCPAGKSADLVQPTEVFALEPKMEMRLINMNIAPRCISDEARREEFIKLRFLIYPGFLL